MTSSNYFFLSNLQDVGTLNEHKKRFHVDKTKRDFKCDKCDYASYAKKYVNAHVLKVHRGKEHYKHICEHCGKKFLYPFDLKQHHVCNHFIIKTNWGVICL